MVFYKGQGLLGHLLVIYPRRGAQRVSQHDFSSLTGTHTEIMEYMQVLLVKINKFFFFYFLFFYFLSWAYLALCVALPNTTPSPNISSMPQAPSVP